MADQILTLKQVEDTFQSIVADILGYAVGSADRDKKVRIAYPRGGQPAFKIDQDIVFIRVNTKVDPITMQRDVAYSELSADNANRKVSYTRVQSIYFILYGQNSFDNAELIRRSLFLSHVKETLALKHLYLIPDVSIPIRAPEEFSGQWWERTDFSADYNEGVEIDYTSPYLKSTVVKQYTRKGEIT